MRQICVLFLAFCLTGFACIRPNAGLENSLDLGQVWVHKDSEWREAPREAQVNEATAWAKLVIFRPRGEFVMLRCSLIKQGNVVRISQGDPIALYRGHWKEADFGAEVEYRAVFRTIAIADQALPGRPEGAKVKRVGQDLVFQEQKFSHLKEFDSASLISVSEGL